MEKLTFWDAEKLLEGLCEGLHSQERANDERENGSHFNHNPVLS